MRQRTGQGRESAMHQIREVFRMKLKCNLGRREIAQSLGLSTSTVRHYLKRRVASGLDYDALMLMSDPELQEALGHGHYRGPGAQRPADDWAKVHKELRRRHMTLQLLWEEYLSREPQGYRYSQYCARYHGWRKKLTVTMRQVHPAGERMFVDFCGTMIPIVDRATGVVSWAPVFVATLGASNYTYAEAMAAQSLPCWIEAHIHAFEFFGGCARQLVCDNLRAGVLKADWYEPELNPTYQKMAEHYGTAVVPARPWKPRDKAKVENGVQCVERWIIMALRNRTFFSVAEANLAIGPLLVKQNNRPFRRLPGSRRSWFEEQERAELRALPVARYEYEEWKNARVHPDYSIEFERHYYVLPSKLAHEPVRVRATAQIVEIFHEGKRVTSYPRSHRKYGRSAHPEYQTPVDWEITEGNCGRLLERARKWFKGPIAECVARILTEAPHPTMRYRAGQCLLGLVEQYPRERVEAACTRMLQNSAVRLSSIKSVLEKGLDREPLPAARPVLPDIAHANLRGPAYFQPTLELPTGGAPQC